ncbi:MAG: SAM-dependent methyltransferase [Luteibaculaceae bacterium]|jgi:SAM-dependent methyltransferase
MEKEYYKAYYHLERKHWWFLARSIILQKKIEQFLPKKDGLKILNVGAATGGTSQMLEQFGAVTSVEYDRDCFTFLKGILSSDVIHGSITELPFNDSQFDLVCGFDVLEHVQDDKLAMQELTRVTKQNGVVFVTVPAFQSLWSSHDDVNHHFRRYSKGGLLELIKSLNVKREYLTFFNFFLFPPIALFRYLFGKKKSDFSKKKSDFHKVERIGKLNGLLFWIFKFESIFINANLRFPIGVSLMLITKKE